MHAQVSACNSQLGFHGQPWRKITARLHTALNYGLNTPLSYSLHYSCGNKCFVMYSSVCSVEKGRILCYKKRFPVETVFFYRVQFIYNIFQSNLHQIKAHYTHLKYIYSMELQCQSA